MTLERLKELRSALERDIIAQNGALQALNQLIAEEENQQKESNDPIRTNRSPSSATGPREQ